MNSIDYFDVIKIYELFCKSQLSLCCGLLKPKTWLTSTVSIIFAIGSSKFFSFIVVLCSTCDGATPYNIEAIIVNRNINILGYSSLKLEIIVVRLWIYEEALLDWPRLYAL